MKSGTLGVVAVMAFLFLVPAIYNGFPFVFDDTGIYLRAAVARIVPEERPIYYSIFARLLHWHVSAWPVAIAQSLIMATLIWMAGHRLFALRGTTFYILLAGALTLGTSLPWFTGLLIPDIFASALVLALMLLGFAWERLSVAERLFLLLGIAASVSFHYANLSLALGSFLVFALLAIVGWRPSSRTLPRFAAMAGATGLGVVALILPNAVIFGKVEISPAASVFLLGRLLDDGSAMEVLAEECPSRNWRLCDEIENMNAYLMRNARTPDPSLDPLSDYFLWYGPLNRMGGFRVYRDEASDIVAATLARYPSRTASLSIRNTFVQFVNVHVGDALPALPPDNYAIRTLDTILGPGMSTRALQSVQGRNMLPLGEMNALFGVVLILSVVPLTAALFLGRQRDAAAFYLVLALILFLAGNAAVTGSLSGVFDRYQARMVWLAPLFAMLLWRRWGGVFPRVPNPSTSSG